MSLLCMFKWTVTVVNVLEYDTVLTARYVQYILYRSGNTGRGSQHYTRHRESCSTVSPAARITSDSMDGCFACHSVLQSPRWDHCATVEICMLLQKTKSLILFMLKFWLEQLSYLDMLLTELPTNNVDLLGVCEHDQAVRSNMWKSVLSQYPRILKYLQEDYFW